MSAHVKCDRAEKQPVTDSKYEADSLLSFIHSLSISVEYSRSFEYCLERKSPMYPRRSSRPPKVSKRRSPSPDEGVIERKLRGRRQKTELRKTKEDNGVVDADEGKGLDIIDIINSSLDAKRVAEEDEGKFVEVADEGVDGSDEDCSSVNSSVASGPSLLRSASPKKLRPSKGLCSACKARYQKAKKMKAPLKNKLLNNDPKSLTCDQWVLMKKWRPRRLPDARGKLSIHVQLVKKRLEVKNGANRPAQYVGEEESSACLRPHAFLQRNLRRRVRVKPVKKNRRKRTRDGSQGPRIAKQQRLHSNNRRQHISVDLTSGHNSSSPGLEGCSGQEVSDKSDTNLAVELIPSTVAMETIEPKEVPPVQKAPKRTGGFRDLLAQLRGNSSRIVRETR
ncbi:uncharacterized protein si:ch211-227n13.3 isoform X1 [Sebastes umbrosus]|uniref:uncharacterized protein si:ch211-227n13.3 isoform X1 n=2 Tax=Sebastes umbrosus TaxID=72105 RepID=UPI00189C73D1|nr:uncharacterized protein si:ch211-227n13.3 isoform X1 [Sebastes umbrosus]